MLLFILFLVYFWFGLREVDVCGCVRLYIRFVLDYGYFDLDFGIYGIKKMV